MLPEPTPDEQAAPPLPAPDAEAAPPPPPETAAAPAADAAPQDDTAPPDDSAAAAAVPAAPELAPAACAARLAELFPALFGGGRVLPLKLRIQADIQQRAPGVFSRKSLSLFLHRHTTSTAYLRALAQAEQRFDLDGQPAGELAEEHRAAASAELERRHELFEARRVAEREASRAAEAQRREQAANQAVERAERGERAALLGAFEASTLARVNFCALTGLSEEELEQQLTLARKEQAEVAAAPVGARPPPSGGHPPGGRRDGLPPRRPRGRPQGPRQP